MDLYLEHGGLFNRIRAISRNVASSLSRKFPAANELMENVNFLRYLKSAGNKHLCVSNNGVFVVLICNVVQEEGVTIKMSIFKMFILKATTFQPFSSSESL